jgi:hypothetical protein
LKPHSAHNHQKQSRFTQRKVKKSKAWLDVSATDELNVNDTFQPRAQQLCVISQQQTPVKGGK